VEPTTHEPLPLALPDATPAVTCWYCGSDRGPFEREHQLPVSRGGGEAEATRLVWADARCNALKGPLDVEEFREGLAERLGLDPAQVVFAG
jgi:5-methylcytosine-specific restriction endonuclease McrA